MSSQVEKWSADWNWVLRARAWDDECDRRRRESQLREIEAMGQRQAQQAEAGAAVLVQPITALLLRVQEDPTVFTRSEAQGGVTLKDLMQLAIQCARALGTVHQAERVARGIPELAGTEKSDALMDLKNAQFTWVEGQCTCGHRHSKHDQMYEADPTLTPCTVRNCGCRRFRDQDDA